MDIHADYLGNFDKLNDVNPPFARFDICNKRLVLPKPLGKVGLCDASFFTGISYPFNKQLLSRRTDCRGHLTPEDDANYVRPNPIFVLSNI